MNSITEVVFGIGVLKRFLRKNSGKFWFVTRVGFCRELEFYIACHEAQGLDIDHDCLSVVYDDRITVNLRLERGEWVITAVIVSAPLVSFSPIYIWKLIKRGIDIIPARFFAAWNARRSPSPACF